MKILKLNDALMGNLDLRPYFQFCLGSYAPLLQEQGKLFKVFRDFLCEKIEQEIISVDNIKV